MQPNYKKMNIEAIEKHLSRQYSARSKKKEKEDTFDTGVGSGTVWRNQTTEATTPRTLKMSMIKRDQACKKLAYINKLERVKRNHSKRRFSPAKRANNQQTQQYIH